MAIRCLLAKHEQQTNAAGQPLGGGLVEVVEPGTSTPIQAFRDSSLTTAWGTQIRLSGSGRAEVWVARNCDMRIFDRNGNRIIEELEANPDFGSQASQGGLLVNGSFENDTDGDGTPDDWTLVSYTGASNGISEEESTDGSRSFRFTSSGSGGGELAGAALFPVNDVEALRLTLDLLSTPSDVHNIVRVEWFDISQVAISTADVYDEDTDNPTSWETQNLAANPPNGARFARVRIIGIDSGTPASGTVYVDRLSAFYPEEAEGVFDNVTIQDNQIITTDGALEITPAAGGVNLGNGSDPDLADVLNTLNLGSANPGGGSHLALGPTRIQAKSDGTTATDMAIQSLGGGLSLGAQSGSGTVYVWKDGERVLRSATRANGGIEIYNNATGGPDAWDRPVTSQELKDITLGQTDSESTGGVALWHDGEQVGRTVPTADGGLELQIDSTWRKVLTNADLAAAITFAVGGDNVARTTDRASGGLEVHDGDDWTRVVTAALVAGTTPGSPTHVLVGNGTDTGGLVLTQVRGTLGIGTTDDVTFGTVTATSFNATP